MLLKFCTGSSTIPPLGFSHPFITVNFSSLDYISPSTCFMTLTLPQSFPDYNTFAMAMRAATSGSGFESA